MDRNWYGLNKPSCNSDGDNSGWHSRKNFNQNHRSLGSWAERGKKEESVNLTSAIPQILLTGIITGFLIGRIIAKIEIAALSRMGWNRRRELKRLLLREPSKKSLKYKISSTYLTSLASGRR